MPAHGREIDWPGCLGGSGPNSKGEEERKEHVYDSTQAPAEQQQPRADTDSALRWFCMASLPVPSPSPDAILRIEQVSAIENVST